MSDESKLRHRLLERQLKKHYKGPAIPPEWDPFLKAVDQAYQEYDNDRVLSERSLKISSDEMLAVMEDLRIEKEKAQRLRFVAEDAAKTKTEFFTNMSHELRTPLHAIISFSALGERKAHLGDEKKNIRYFNKIHGSGKVLLRLLNDLLDLAKFESGKMTFDFKVADLNEAITQIAEEFESLALEKHIQIQCKYKAKTALFSFDFDKIKQVLRNLLFNALKHSPAGKSIEIVCEPRDDKMIVSVSDEGAGIPENELETIFDEFIQSAGSKAGSGTGLGLSICRKIVAAHGGRLRVKNCFFGGATFAFDLSLSGDGNSAVVSGSPRNNGVLNA